MTLYVLTMTKKDCVLTIETDCPKLKDKWVKKGAVLEKPEKVKKEKK